MMRKLALATAVMLSTGALTATTADAGWRGGGWGQRHYYGGYGYHRRGIGPGAAIGLGIAGLAAGAIAAGAARDAYYRDRYYRRGYYDPYYGY